MAVEGQPGRLPAQLNKLLHGRASKHFRATVLMSPEEAVEGGLLKPALPQNPFHEGPLGPVITGNQTGAL